MEKYNLKSKCSKCGYDGLAENFTLNTYFPLTEYQKSVIIQGKKEECILRTCQRCGYTWHEEPLDVNGLKDQ